MIREFHAFFLKFGYYYARKPAGGEGWAAPEAFKAGSLANRWHGLKSHRQGLATCGDENMVAMVKRAEHKRASYAPKDGA
jgi:hypothetical protein